MENTECSTVPGLVGQISAIFLFHHIWTSYMLFCSIFIVSDGSETVSKRLSSRAQTTVFMDPQLNSSRAQTMVFTDPQLHSGQIVRTFTQVVVLGTSICCLAAASASSRALTVAMALMIVSCRNASILRCLSASTLAAIVACTSSTLTSQTITSRLQHIGTVDDRINFNI